MARDGIVTLFNLDDAKISKLTADTASALTYANSIDVPGIQNISMKPEFLSKELAGDAKILDYYTKLRKITGSVKHAQISLPVLEALMGGTLANSGATPNEKATLTLKGSDLPNYVKIEGQVKYLGGSDAGGSGDFHATIPKAKLSNFQVEFQNEDYAVVSFDYEAIPTTYDDKILILEENETAVAIATTADSTAPTVSSVSPTDGATGVAVNANVVWTFSEALRLDTVSLDNFMIVKASDGTNVAGALSYNAGTFAVTFDPTVDLGALTAYIAIATKAVRDAAGNQLAAHSYTNFTTA